MMSKKRAVGLFTSYEISETALGELKDRGFSMDQVTLVGRDIKSHAEATGVHTIDRVSDLENLHTHKNDLGDAAKTGAAAETTLESLTGLLIGLGAVAIPGVGPVMLAGATTTTAIATISGGLIGAAAGSLAGGLVGLGIPHDRAESYSGRVSKGEYLMLVEGSEVDLTLAESVFKNQHMYEWYVCDLSHDKVELSARPVDRLRA